MAEGIDGCDQFCQCRALYDAGFLGASFIQGALGFFKKSQAEEYKRKHQTELNTYKIHHDVLKDMIKEPDKKINPKAWQKELDGLREKYQKTERPLSEATLNLAKMENKKLIPEQESAVVDNDTCASSLPTSTVKRTIGKTTYIANLHFKEQGQTFAQKLKRVLRAECSV